MPDGSICIYCGGIALQWDHVVSVRALRPETYQWERFCPGDWIVLSCTECNGLLSDRMLHTVPLRAGWLYGRYRQKYAKLMGNARWTDDELDELQGTFRMLVIETMLAQSELDHRLSTLRRVAAMGMDYGR